MHQPVKSIEYVVTSALSRLGLDHASFYDWLEQIAIEHYSEIIGVTTTPKIEIAEFGVGNGSRIWSMPSDYIRHSRVMYRVRDAFYTLTRVYNLANEPEACEVVPSGQDNGVGGIYEPSEYFQGTFYGPSFTANGGLNRAYYQIDDGNREIKFSLQSEHLPNGIAYIEYLSSGKPCGQTLVRPAYIEPARNYLIWMCHEYGHMTGMDVNFAKDKERQYHESMYNHTAAESALTVSEILDATWGSSGFSLR
jgi:hypothetical protein